VSEAFSRRHIGPDAGAQDAMLRIIGVPSLDTLIEQTIPSGIRFAKGLDLPPAESEAGYLRRLRSVVAKNRVARSYIGMGYYDTHTPAVILRNVFENPGWYTPYTPYQAEIAQGRLESLLNFQTVVRDLTAMEIASASLLDEGTAAAEAMTMFHRLNTKRAPAGEESVFLVSARTFPQTIDVLRGRAMPLGIRIEVGDPETLPLTQAFGLLLQYPDDHGEVRDLEATIKRAHDAGVLVAVASDLMALTLLVPPGEMGADAVVGNSQRFGVPLGYGGPHAAFFATRESFVRQAPGRIIGVSIDARGKRAYRMALATREQHIRREKATSNICTAQALLANIAAMYAVYHGPHGLRAIGERIHGMARAVEDALVAAGLTQTNAAYFDTVRIEGAKAATVRAAADATGLNFRYFADGAIGISVDETTTIQDVADIVAAFTGGNKPVYRDGAPPMIKAPVHLRRTSAYLTHPIFNSYHSETEMMRYIRSLERKDVGLDTSMIPLGSCTMKLNAAAEMLPVTWAGFSRDLPRSRGGAVRGHRVRRHVAAAELRRAGRVHRLDGDPCLPPRSRAGRPRRRVDPRVRAWHQSGERDDGGSPGGCSAV
jgi:glycine dehydrogenase